MIAEDCVDFSSSPVHTYLLELYVDLYQVTIGTNVEESCQTDEYGPVSWILFVALAVGKVQVYLKKQVSGVCLKQFIFLKDLELVCLFSSSPLSVVLNISLMNLTQVTVLILYWSVGTPFVQCLSSYSDIHARYLFCR